MRPNASTADDVRRSSPSRGSKTRGTTAAAIWAACLAAGIGIGVLTDGDGGPLPQGRGGESHEDRDVLPPPDSAGGLVDQAAGVAGSRPGDTGDSAGGADEGDAPAGGDGAATPATAPTVPDVHALVEGLPPGPARAILEDLLPGIVLDPPIGEEPGGSTSTTEAPSATTTTEAATTTTETTTPPGGSDPVVTPLPDVRDP